ncbi:MAG: DUF192 domain-containing protein [Halobacteria archaeon]
MIQTEDGEILADEVEIADGFLEKATGLMLRDRFPEGSALVFDFSRRKRVFVHMMFVRFPVDVLLLDGKNRVVKKTTLQPWRGVCRGKAARMIELPEGVCEQLEEGEKIIFEVDGLE